jgi:hypothetical protein
MLYHSIMQMNADAGFGDTVLFKLRERDEYGESRGAPPQCALGRLTITPSSSWHAGVVGPFVKPE